MRLVVAVSVASVAALVWAGPAAALPVGSSLTAAGVYDEATGPVDVSLFIEDDVATLTLDSLGEIRPSVFPVEWTKAPAAASQFVAWSMTIRGDSDFGEFSVSGVWDAAAPTVAVCTLSYPNRCSWIATGPVALTGLLGGRLVALAGVATDSFCTQGDPQFNIHSPCRVQP